MFYKNSNFNVKTSHTVSYHNGIIETPFFKLFSKEYRKEKLLFHIYDFSNEFDMLIGNDILHLINAKIDYKSKTLKTYDCEIPILFNRRKSHVNLSNLESLDFSQVIKADYLNESEKSSIFRLCNNYRDIFYKEGDKLTFHSDIKHAIKTKDDLPIYTKSYRYPEVHKEEIARQIDSMLDQGIIRHSTSPWSSPLWIVPKKTDASNKKKWRLVVDYRKLNEKTIDDKYPIPNIDEILDKLGRCMYFSTLDLASGFHQIEVNPKDVEKTAFSVNNGHYEFIRMGMGLKNAPSTFQRVMDNVLKDLLNKGCLVYMDDIIVYSTSMQEHIDILTKVFERLRNANFKVQLDKSVFMQREVSFLGHLITPDGVKPNPDKIAAIKKFPIPKTPKQIKSFLGLIGYYRNS